MIDLRHLFGNGIDFAAGPRPLVLNPFGECHTGAPYVIAGRNTAVYSCLALFNVALNVEAATLVYAIVCEVIFA